MRTGENAKNVDICILPEIQYLQRIRFMVKHFSYSKANKSEKNMNNAFFAGNIWSIELGYLFLHITR